MSNADTKKTPDKNPWVGMLHIPKDRIQQFAHGEIEFNDDELGHATVCDRCAHRIADSALMHIEQKGDHPRWKQLWRKLFNK